LAQILTREFTRHVKYKHHIEINTKSHAQSDQSSNHCPKVNNKYQMDPSLPDYTKELLRHEWEPYTLA
jgi:hypothetical protein